MRRDSTAPVEVGPINVTSSIEEERIVGKSAPEPIPDPIFSVGVGRMLVVIAMMPLVTSVEVKAIIGDAGIDLLG